MKQYVSEEDLLNLVEVCTWLSNEEVLVVKDLLKDGMPDEVRHEYYIELCKAARLEGTSVPKKPGE